MKRMRTTAIACGFVALGCGQSSETGLSAASQLAVVGNGAFASVGPDVLHTNELAVVNAESTEAAARLLVHDALFAQRARSTAPQRSAVVERAALGRALLESLEAEQARRNPITDGELNNALSKHWVQLDRPRSVRTVELFIALGALDNDEKAHAEMEKLRKLAVVAHNVESLRELLGSFESDFEIRPTFVPPVTADARVVPLTPQDRRITRVPQALAEEANRLQHPGELSPVFTTEAGVHLLYAVEVVPELRSSATELKKRLRKLILAERTAPVLNALRAARKTKPVFPQRDLTVLTRLAWRRQ